MIVRDGYSIKSLAAHALLPSGLFRKTFIALWVGIILLCHVVDGVSMRSARLLRTYRGRLVKADVAA